MSVDLSRAVKGATVKFSGGGEAVINFCNPREGNPIVTIQFDHDNSVMFAYGVNGKYGYSSIDTPFDIISITPPPFDWATVKPGMAFRHATDGNKVWYIAEDWSCDECIIATETTKEILSENLGVFAKELLTRAPEHNIQVQS